PMNVPNLVILGSQGLGKTTQTELLSKRFRFALFGAGDLLREIAQEDSELGRTVHQTVNVKKRLVPPKLISKMIKEKVAAVPDDRGLILDGYPRNLNQYELFKNFWLETGRGNYQAVFIELPDEEAVKRLTRRVTCENCGAVYIEGTMEKCAKCGGRTIRGPDDMPEGVRNHLQYFYFEFIHNIQSMH